MNNKYVYCKYMLGLVYIPVLSLSTYYTYTVVLSSDSLQVLSADFSLYSNTIRLLVSKLDRFSSNTVVRFSVSSAVRFSFNAVQYIVRCSASVYSDSPLRMYSDSLLVLLSDSLLILYSDALLELELFLCQIFSAILYMMVRKYSELILEQVANY